MKKPSRHRYPMIIIGEAIWQYHRFNQSYRDVREQLVYRGIDVRVIKLLEIGTVNLAKLTL